MSLMPDRSFTFAATLLDDATMRSGLEAVSMSMFGPSSPFDHVGGLLDRMETVEVSNRILTDYSLV